MSTNLIYGVGINDSDTPVRIKRKCIKPFYIWRSMIQRCYDEKYRNNTPTYKDCSVCEEWKYYSKFKTWFDLNYINDYHLDKDILIIGNKVYSPETCRFIPSFINTLLVDRGNDRGLYPIGVNYEKAKNKYKACISRYEKVNHLGYYDTPEEAHESWRLAKIEYVGEVARAYLFSGEISEEIFDALIVRDFR